MKEWLQKINKPVVGGILSIIGGVSFVVAGFFILRADWGAIPMHGLVFAFLYLLVGGIVPVVGGIFALKRKRWLLAFIGSIGATVGGTIIFGVPALVIIVMSRDEFV